MNPTPKHEVTFQEEGHLYLHKQRTYGSLTTYIGNEFPYTGPDKEILRWNGRFLHDCNAAIIAGDLDYEAVPEDLRGGVNALLKFHAEMKPDVIACEIPLVHPSWGYACTPDMIVRSVGGIVGVTAVELKRSWMENVGIQLGGQAIAWDENFPTMPIGSEYGYVVSINAEGGYQFYRYDLDEGRADWAAVLRVQQIKARRNGRG